MCKIIGEYCEVNDEFIGNKISTELLTTIVQYYPSLYYDKRYHEKNGEKYMWFCLPETKEKHFEDNKMKYISKVYHDKYGFTTTVRDYCIAGNVGLLKSICSSESDESKFCDYYVISLLTGQLDLLSYLQSILSSEKIILCMKIIVKTIICRSQYILQYMNLVFGENNILSDEIDITYYEDLCNSNIITPITRRKSLVYIVKNVISVNFDDGLEKNLLDISKYMLSLFNINDLTDYDYTPKFITRFCKSFGDRIGSKNLRLDILSDDKYCEIFQDIFIKTILDKF